MSNQSDLKGLYPFLHGKPQDSVSLDAALMHSVEEKARDLRETNARFFGEQAGALVGAAKALADVYRRGGQLFSMGNGGSSCDASHVAVEFVHPITAGRPALAATNLVGLMAKPTWIRTQSPTPASPATRRQNGGRAPDESGPAAPQWLAPLSRRRLKQLVLLFPPRDPQGQGGAGV